MTNTQTIRSPPHARRALAQTESIVAAVGQDQLGLPTPCYGVRRPHPAQPHGRRPEPDRDSSARAATDSPSRPPFADGVPEDGWLDAYRAAAARARNAWSDDSRLDALVEVPWGKVPGRIAVSGYVMEIVTHSWDLAKATGQPTEGDPELARVRPGHRPPHPATGAQGRRRGSPSARSSTLAPKPAPTPS